MKFEDRPHGETERQQRCARSRAWNLVKNICKLKEKDKPAFYSPAEELVLPAASTKELEEREFVVDSGASMHTVSKKDLKSAELETMRTSRSPTTLMTANGEVQTREEATVYVKPMDLFVKVTLLEETFFHHRILYLMSTDTPKIQYPKEVELRAKSFGETRCMNPQKPKTKIKMRIRSSTKKIFAWIGWLATGIQVEKLVESTSTEPWENLEQGSQDTSKSSHELPMEPRAKVEPGSGKHSVYTHFPKDQNCDICLKTKTTRSSYRRRAGTVVLRAEHFGDLITADHKVLSQESEPQNNHRYAVVVQELATQWIQPYPCETKLLRKHKRA